MPSASNFNPDTGATDTFVNPTAGSSPSGPAGRSAQDDQENDALKVIETRLIAIVAQIAHIQTESTPTGAITAFGQSTVPTGWLSCDGTVYSVSDYPALGALLGNTHGGNGTTTFGVPNIVGQFVLGGTSGVSPGAKGGAATHHHSSSVMTAASHYHAATGLNSPFHAHNAGGTLSTPDHYHSAGSLLGPSHPHNSSQLTAAAHSHGLGTQSYAYINSTQSSHTIASLRVAVAPWGPETELVSASNISGTTQGYATRLGGSTNNSATLDVAGFIDVEGNRPVTGNTGPSDRSLTVTGLTAYDGHGGVYDQGITGQTSSAGSNVTGNTDDSNNIPPYITLPFIIKT